MSERTQTGELTLREVTDADLPVFFRQQLDPEANHMAAVTPTNPADRAAFDAHWAKIRADDNVTMRTVLVDGQVAGYVATYMDDEFQRPAVAYWLGKEYWGRGVASRALSEFLEGVTERPVYGRAAADNAASIRVMEKCGFVLTGYGRIYAAARGGEIEEVILVLR